MILCLSGGVGGARFANGLVAALPDADIRIVVNTGDDFEHLGLPICPDIDTVMYTLAGIENPELGWGRRDETWRMMEALSALGGPSWFKLGDSDLAMHLERHRQLSSGMALHEVIEQMSERMGIEASIAPMTNHPVRTMIKSNGEALSFQDYFVRLRCEPVIESLWFAGVTDAETGPWIDWLRSDTLEGILIGPSNPLVSIDPILALRGVREAFGDRQVPAVVVSPIIGGRAVKGPLAKMMRELGIEPTNAAIAAHYRGIIDGIVIDKSDAANAPAIRAMGIEVLATNTLMHDTAARAALARETIAFARSLIRPSVG